MTVMSLMIILWIRALLIKALLYGVSRHLFGEKDTRTYANVSEFYLTSVFNGSTIKNEGSWARRCQAPLSLRHENLDEVFGSITISNQIVCIKEVEE